MTTIRHSEPISCGDGIVEGCGRRYVEGEMYCDGEVCSEWALRRVCIVPCRGSSKVVDTGIESRECLNVCAECQTEFPDCLAEFEKEIVDKFEMDLGNDDLWVELKGDQLHWLSVFGRKVAPEYARRFPDSSVGEVVGMMFREYKEDRVQEIIDLFKSDLKEWYPDMDHQSYIKYVESNAKLFEDEYLNHSVGEIVVYMFTDYDD